MKKINNVIVLTANDMPLGSATCI